MFLNSIRINLLGHHNHNHLYRTESMSVIGIVYHDVLSHEYHTHSWVLTLLERNNYSLLAPQLYARKCPCPVPNYEGNLWMVLCAVPTDTKSQGLTVKRINNKVWGRELWRGVWGRTFRGISEDISNYYGQWKSSRRMTRMGLGLWPRTREQDMGSVRGHRSWMYAMLGS